MIGVVIPAHNEAQWLPRCLASIKNAAQHPALAWQRVKIYVVLDACTDASQDIVDAAGATRVVTAAHNVGQARAEGAVRAIIEGAHWLAFTDADCEVPKDWLAAQQAWHLEKQAEVVCGTVLMDDWSMRSTRCRERYEAQYHAQDGHKHIHGANLGMSAAAYLRAGGFEPLRHGEDVTLVTRLVTLGESIAWPGAPAVLTSTRAEHRAPRGIGYFLNMLDAGLM